jgi:hypothetical protein
MKVLVSLCLSMLERIDIKNLVNGAWNESNYIDRYNIYIERERA